MIDWLIEWLIDWVIDLNRSGRGTVSAVKRPPWGGSCRRIPTWCPADRRRTTLQRNQSINSVKKHKKTLWRREKNEEKTGKEKLDKDEKRGDGGTNAREKRKGIYDVSSDLSLYSVNIPSTFRGKLEILYSSNLSNICYFFFRF